MSPLFYAWSDSRDAAVTAPLEVELRKCGTSLIQFDPAAPAPIEPAALVIFLSDNLLESAGVRLVPTIESWDGPIVPVAVHPDLIDAPARVRAIAWVRAYDESPDAAVGRIGVSVRTSPAWLLAWQGLQVAADRRQPDGTGALLGQREVDRAEDTVRARPSDLLPEVPEEILTLLHESRRVISRRRRRRVAAALAAALVLIAIAAVALLQRHSATVAKARAERATTRSEADRLSRLARQALDTDPDLPVLLARRAYQLEPGSQARESLRSALDAAPWHRSYRLNTPPARLATSRRSPLVAVVGNDGSASLFDSSTGRKLASAPRPSGIHGTPTVAVSANGRRLALAYAGGLVQVRRFDQAFGLLWSMRLANVGKAASDSIAWMPEGRRLLTAWESRAAQLVDMTARRTDPVPRSGVADPIAISVSPNGRMVAMAGDHRIAILRTKTMQLCWSASRKSSSTLSLAFDERHSMLVVAREGAFALQIPIPRSCGARPVKRPELSGLIWSYSDVVTPLAGGGVALGNSDGRLVLVEPPGIYPAGRFLAHASAVMGAGVVAGGSLVTVGDDSWMRVWQPPGLPAYPIGPAWNLRLNEASGKNYTRGSWRPMIASDPRGSTVTLGGLSSGSVTVLRSAHLDHVVRSFFVAIDSSIRPAGTTPCRALLFNGTATLLRCAGNRIHTVWKHKFTDDADSVYQSALSADGRVLAVAGLDTVDLIKPPHGSMRSFNVSDLRGLGFDRDDQLFAVSADGSILEAKSGGTARARPGGSARLSSRGRRRGAERARGSACLH